MMAFAMLEPLAAECDRFSCRDSGQAFALINCRDIEPVDQFKNAKFRIVLPLKPVSLSCRFRP